MLAHFAKLMVVLAAGGFGWWVGPAPLRDVIGDTIAVFAILAAFLIQIMLLLVTAFNPGSLSADRVLQITQALAAQQKHASYVFFGYLTAIVFGVMLKAATPGAANAVFGWSLHGISAVVLASSTFGLLGTIRFVGALRSIQVMRQSLLISEAKDREKQEAAQRKAESDNIAFLNVPPPVSYGKRFGG
jgi:hypothetical protein